MNEAVSLGRDGSVADGFWTQSVGLPFPVVCFDIDLFAFNHSEVTSDKNGSLGSFRALCARALAKTNKNLDCVFVHVNSIFLKMLASRERPSESTSSACLLTNRAPALNGCSVNISLGERLSKLFTIQIQR